MRYLSAPSVGMKVTVRLGKLMDAAPRPYTAKDLAELSGESIYKVRAFLDKNRINDRVQTATMPVYYLNFMQMMKQMVYESNQITFRGCPSGELLAPYAQAFRLMNPKAVYLRQDPMGYHEKAFGLFLPFPLEESEITITEKSYLPLWLDALDHPEHYDGKLIHFTDPIELRRTDENSPWTCGRVVMTCCMADLQFMSFELDDSSSDACESTYPSGSSWVTIDASAKTVSDSYGQRKLLLVPEGICRADPSDELILDGRKGQ